MYRAFKHRIGKALLIFLLIFVSCQTVDSQPAPLQAAVQDLWFNTLANKMSLSAARFQLYPGTTAVGSTSLWMWQIFDAIPSKSTGHYYTPQQANSFSFDYSLLLSAMRAGSANYMFDQAILMYASAGGEYAWDKTITDFKNALAAGRPMHLDTTVTLTYVSDSTSGTKSTVVVNMQAQFNKYTTFYASPYSKVDSLKQGLSFYKPWFSTLMFSQAFNVSNNIVWNPQQPITWQKAFGVAGFMQNMCIALVVADGVSIKISFWGLGTQSAQGILFSDTSKNSTSNLPIIYTAGNSTDSTYADNQGNFVSSISIPQGNPVLLGVLVCPMDAFANHPQYIFTGIPSLR
jgi:hypothetical protein